MNKKLVETFIIAKVLFFSFAHVHVVFLRKNLDHEMCYYIPFLLGKPTGELGQIQLRHNVLKSNFRTLPIGEFIHNGYFFYKIK